MPADEKNPRYDKENRLITALSDKCAHFEKKLPHLPNAEKCSMCKWWLGICEDIMASCNHPDNKKRA